MNVQSHQSHAITTMAIVREAFSPSTADGGGHHDDSAGHDSTSDDDDIAPSSKFLADLKTESVRCRNELAKQEKRFEELKKVHHASMENIVSIYTTLEKTFDAHLGQLEAHSSSLLAQQHRLEELLTKDYSVASSPSKANELKRDASSVEAATPPRKRSKAAAASPTPVRLLPPRKAAPAHELPPTLRGHPGKPPARGRPAKADDSEVHDVTEFAYHGRWDVARCGQFSEIDQQGRRMRSTSSGWNVVIGREPADSFVVRVSFPTTKQKNSVAIGLTKEPNFWKEPLQATHSAFDFNQFGWFLNVQRGALCSKAGHDNAPYCTRFKTGDVLAVVLDTDTSTMRFFKNGKDLGVAFTDVTERDMYPAVITYDRGIKLELL
ncbi:hypothetical protein DYB28_015111, partial [Aphanomyces astaci]|uniref:B30.2/SPRY domain-containing protein n=2 Tax=Aphanomyces astaci TaxID=112090 RepID=A0A397AR44_APHAT